MVRFATIVALALLLQACRPRKEEIIYPPVTIAPTLCNAEERLIEIAEIRRLPRSGKAIFDAFEFLLDLKVHVRNAGRLWLLVNEPSFPKHVREVHREDVAWRDVDGAPPMQVRYGPRQQDPQVDWVFEGDGYYVKARLLAPAGDVTVKYIRTGAPRRGIPVVLATIEVDNMHPPDWVANGGGDDHRSTYPEARVRATIDVHCVDWLDIDPHAAPGELADD